MARSGEHRIRHLARWVATPALLLAAALVVFATYDGGADLLTGAAFGALAAGILAVSVFDIELLRSRRNHGADRVAQARAYAAMYAAHVRVMSEGFELSDPRRTPAARARGQAVPVDDPLFGKRGRRIGDEPVDQMPATLPPPDLTDVPVGAAADQEDERVAAIAARVHAADAGQIDAVAADREAEVDATEPGSGSEVPAADAPVEVADAPGEPAPVATEVAPVDQPGPASVPAAATLQPGPADADADEAPAEMWNDFLDAPTVVDLMAWEVRARLAAEEERVRQDEEAAQQVHQEARAAGAATAEAAAAGGGKPAVRAKSSRNRRTRRRKGA